jgi:hypothetical protein
MKEHAVSESLQKEVSEFLMQGIELEGRTLEHSVAIRERSKEKYKQEWLDARLQLLAISAHLINQKDSVPGRTSVQISERLTLIMVFLQGAYATETLITEGQYIKATAALKQDLEILARIAEVKHDVAKQGRVPNVKYAPEGSQRFYGQLNDVAHPSNLELLQSLLGSRHHGDVHGVSYVPTFVEETAFGLYELHVWLLFEVVREHLLLFIEMYGEADAAMKKVVPWTLTTVDTLRRAGFTFAQDELSAP